MTHDHGESGAGFFAGMSAMMFMLIGLVLVVLLVAAFAWRPWGGDGDADTGTGGGAEETLPGDQPGGGDGGGGTGGGTAPGSYRFGVELPSVVAADAALTGVDYWNAIAA